jgi:putative Mn2+ efflux pump MntP
MKKFLKALFSDQNSINEKMIIGVITFILFFCYAIIDIIMGIFGKNFNPTEYIFNGIMVIILGSFGIASFDKWINKRHSNKKDEDLFSDEPPFDE